MKLSRKLVAAISAGVLAFAMFGMAGCSSEGSDGVAQEKTTEEINAQDIQVTGSGFTVLPDNTVNYAFTVENPNEGYVANSVTFTIEGYDENDVMLVGGGETLQEVYPGVTTAAAGTAYLSDETATIARFEVKPLMQNVLWTKTTETTDDLMSQFEITNTEVTEAADGMTITGTISTDLGEESSSSDSSTSYLDNRTDAHVVAIFRDADGNIVGGGSAAGIMLDSSMIPITTGSTPSTGSIPGESSAAEAADAENAEVIAEPNDAELVSGEPTNEDVQEAEEAAAEGGNVASTTFTITIPGVISYANMQIYATPGI
ncbi:MAG: hypothetical protein HFJ65_06325 [Eggerthellaceae bacterium]|nr:hypothetical protein [Eggerthellaceae bacterium]